MHAQVLLFLFSLRELHPELEHQCLNGSCFRLHQLLKLVFPGAEPWYDLEARQASAFRPGKDSAKPVRASLGATDQSAAVAQERQPCELFPIASA